MNALKQLEIKRHVWNSDSSLRVIDSYTGQEINIDYELERNPMLKVCVSILRRLRRQKHRFRRLHRNNKRPNMRQRVEDKLINQLKAGEKIKLYGW